MLVNELAVLVKGCCCFFKYVYKIIAIKLKK